MKFIIGLGNPGKKFIYTRHNVGFMLVDKLVETLAKKPKWQESKKGKLKYCWVKALNNDIELIKPQTFMNKSGLAASYLKKKHFKDFKTKNVFVVHDDLDIQIGDYKIQLGKGPKQHNGLNSLENHLQTKEFWRIRIGVENRKSSFEKFKILGEDYV
ncbi:aminoacyl-tRNA hydrolase, partial [Patescibacteria group bacterium]